MKKFFSFLLLIAAACATSGCVLYPNPYYFDDTATVSYVPTYTYSEPVIPLMYMDIGVRHHNHNSYRPLYNPPPHKNYRHQPQASKWQRPAAPQQKNRQYNRPQSSRGQKPTTRQKALRYGR